MCVNVPPYHFYVYTLSYPYDNPHTRRGTRYGLVFYVGKGIGARIHLHEEDARRGCDCQKCQVIRDIWNHGGYVRKRIHFTTRDERAAFERERELIHKIGLENLTNKTWGSDSYISTAITRYEP